MGFRKLAEERALPWAWASLDKRVTRGLLPSASCPLLSLHQVVPTPVLLPKPKPPALQRKVTDPDRKLCFCLFFPSHRGRRQKSLPGQAPLNSQKSLCSDLSWTEKITEALEGPAFASLFLGCLGAAGPALLTGRSFTPSFPTAPSMVMTLVFMLEL